MEQKTTQYFGEYDVKNFFNWAKDYHRRGTVGGEYGYGKPGENKVPDEFVNNKNGNILQCACKGGIAKERKIFSDYDARKTDDLYYTVAFANYWKRTIEKELKRQGIKANDSYILSEMKKSLPAMNSIFAFIISREGVLTNYEQGINASLSAGGYPYKFPYEKALLRTFTKDPIAVDALANAGIRQMAKTDKKFAVFRFESEFTNPEQTIIMSKSYKKELKPERPSF